MRLSSATTGKSYKTWKSCNKASSQMGRGSTHNQFRVTQIRPLDAKQSHPVIYSIFLISTSLNSQHLNDGNAKRVSFWIHCSPTKSPVKKKKNAPPRQLQFNNN